MHNLPVIFLMGPTCSGKTALAVELVRRLPLDIVSVDSALVYRGLEIGAARPDAETLAVAPHRLLGFRDPAEPYSAADFREDALREIQAIHARRRIPLLVGGTMLYFRTLVTGLADLPAADANTRADIEAEASRLGWPAMHDKLAEVDPATAARLKPNDSQRIQRALEVWLLTGEPLASLHARDTSVPLSDIGHGPTPAFPYTFQSLAVAPCSRAELHDRIARRFRQMLDDGLVEEVAQLKRRPDLTRELPAIRSVGYRQVWDYLEGNCEYETMIERGIVATRQLAKRQFTWLRRWPELTWLDSDTPDLVNRTEALLAPLVESLLSTR